MAKRGTCINECRVRDMTGFGYLNLGAYHNVRFGPDNYLYVDPTARVFQQRRRWEFCLERAANGTLYLTVIEPRRLPHNFYHYDSSWPTRGWIRARLK